ncbi:MULTISPECIES: hypothetical protein [Deinococcus]|uniref:Phage portal protein n=1 Tax=Deinococcus rufus TaxID=2136097 RepID=A0ABV7ZBM5_9DEIO|nr:hypothetical protein [Deinococcus sp. AB2017081]WQE94054.1 hypothetical protein U2P90_11605 [Deinococcus sp. AB2017081]
MTLTLPASYAPAPAARVLKQGQGLVSKRAGDATLTLTATLFAGDHWAGGAGWSGPLPRNAADGELTGLVTGEIQRTFVSRNLLRDVVIRHRNGIAGREPLWTLSPRRGLKKAEKPTADEQGRIDAYSAALTEWWDESGAWPAVQQALDTALWSGSGHLRLFISADALDDLAPDADGRPQRGIRSGTPLADVMKKLSVHAPAWAQSAVTRDTDGRVTGAVHTWTDDGGRPHSEVHERVGGKTVLHPDLLPAGTDADGRPAVEYPVPDLLLYELRLTPLVTDSIRRLSRWLDKTLTMGSRNIDLGGFTETTLLNAQMPEGEYVTEPGTGRKVWKAPRPHLRGAGVVNYVTGFPILKPDPDTGKMVPGGVSTPSIVYKDPTPFAVFQDSLNTARELIYDEAQQLHVLITGDAAANGISRQQAVNDFLSGLETTRIQLEALLRWLLSTVLALALHLSGQAGAAQDLRVRVQARASAVQPTPAEVETALKLHQTGSISEETFLQRVGVEDVQAERDTRASEGITPAIALRLCEAAPAPWIATRALQLAFPALGIADADVAAQKAIDLMETGSEPGGTDAQDNLPDDGNDDLEAETG